MAQVYRNTLENQADTRHHKIRLQADFMIRLALLNDFRTFDWAEEYKYPTVVLDQMKGLLAKYENL